MNDQRGFTLIEMIGVLAVIAILAAIVAPKIIEAINEARMNSLAEEIASIRTAVASYYKDTGAFPAVNGSRNDLMSKPQGIKNWNGPYLEKQLTNPVNPNGQVSVGQGNWNFDIDGDGNNDYGQGTAKQNVAMTWISGLTADQARRLSQIIDGDGDNTANNASAWYRAGRVRTSNAADPAGSNWTTVYVFLGAY